MKIIECWKDKAKGLTAEVRALYYAYKDPRVPWYAKAFAACVVGYALSPIDLIPDFIPVLGHLDDLILIPLGIMIAVKMIPKDVLKEARSRAARESDSKKPVNWAAAAGIVLFWVFLAAMFTMVTLKILKNK